MYQAIVRKGKVTPEEVPAPLIDDDKILIRVVNSAISAGTEYSGVVSSGTSIARRVVSQPEKVIKTARQIQQVGLSKVYQQLKGLLEYGNPTGYSISGIVVHVGKNIKSFKRGDYVAAAGGGFATHAEYVEVPENLTVNLPGKLDFKAASTVTIGAIAMHGVRRAKLTLGEFGLVIGSGLIGLLTIQILRLSGVRVIVSDPDERRLNLAKEMGAEFIINPTKDDIVKQVKNFTDGNGADAVIFTAATNSSEPLSQAFQSCKRKGKVILVGVSGMEIDRKDIYPKEIDFIISTSYGPGRYDDDYELKGRDYPFSYVRWTEKRNFSEYLRLVSTEEILIEPLIEKVFPFQQVEEAFHALKDASDKPVLLILDYGMPEDDKLEEYSEINRTVHLKKPAADRNKINVALIGTGNFARGVHLPNLTKLKSKYNLHAVVSHTGHHAKSIADQYGGSYATTDYDKVLDDEHVDLVFICTRHALHGEMVLRALEKGKSVFVEKPLAINKEELEAIEAFYKKNTSAPLLMVGFNRRFSKIAKEIKKHTDARINPLFIRYRMNAGYLDNAHWVFSEGGRIVGEACHIIDLMQYIVGSRIIEVSSSEITPNTDHFKAEDNITFTLKFDDGSIAAIDYFSTGSNQVSKEYMEVHFDSKSIIMDDFKELKGYGLKLNEKNYSQSEKGHLNELISLFNTLTEGGDYPIPLEDIFQNTNITLQLQ
ncbi:MAG: bi-domain-containing oxidoreductase [Bacteroidales bacterium]|nr:bi-domain-containing oxidoreductase [Bacteroidales bacterium]MDT8432412.1 bi-domain-containing oxidoreductase [Bacteroidales bacterium]